MKLSEIYTKEKLQIPLISIDSSKEEVAYIDGYEDGVKYSLDTLTPQIAIDFVEYIEDNYYYNSSAWLNRDTDEFTPKSDIWEEFLKQYKPET